MTTIPEQVLHIMARTELAISQPTGRRSIRRPRMALRMMMNGPAKIQNRAEPKLRNQVSSDNANFGGSEVTN